MARSSRLLNSGSVDKLKAALRNHFGEPLSASDLKKITGVPKSQVRRLLRVVSEVKVSPRSPYAFSWARDRKQFLFYLRPSTPIEAMIDVVASNQFERVELGVGDTLWLVSLDGDNHLLLRGRLRVDSVDHRRTAENKLNRKDLWEAERYALTATPEMSREINISPLARRLRFHGSRDRLPIRFTGQHLQSMRRLTQESGSLLEQRWSRRTGDKRPAGDKWGAGELQSAIHAYLDMLQRHRDGRPFVKKHYYRDLAAQYGRTDAAFERRAMNISYVLSLQGRQWLPGLRPLPNVGINVIAQIEELLAKEDNVSTEGTATFRAKVAAARKRKQFNKPGGNKNPKATVVNSMTYSRDPNVVAWVQAEAKGKCEYCKKWGPFKSSLNERYLEVHHVRPLSDRGPDVVANAVALCPNCHRAFHYSIDRAERTKELYRQVSRLE